jgi:hypothetical protein
LREDDGYQLVRLRSIDNLPDVEIGLYHACGTCAKEHRERLAARQPKPAPGKKKKKAEEFSEYEQM